MFFCAHPGVGWSCHFLLHSKADFCLRAQLLLRSRTSGTQCGTVVQCTVPPTHRTICQRCSPTAQQQKQELFSNVKPNSSTSEKTSPTYLLQNQWHSALVFCTNAPISKKRWKFEPFPVPILRSALGFVNRPTHCLDTFYDVEGIYLSLVWPLTSDQGNQKGIFDM